MRSMKEIIVASARSGTRKASASRSRSHNKCRLDRKRTVIEYELINPSDAYTFFAPTLLIAACAVFVLGEGKYGAHPVDSKDTDLVPIFLFGGHDAWLKDRGVDDLPTYIDEHRCEIATCLDSFLIGTHNERCTMEKVLAEIRDPNDREKAREKWIDGRRSSMNNIGLRAKQLAMLLRKPTKADETATQP